MIIVIASLYLNSITWYKAHSKNRANVDYLTRVPYTVLLHTRKDSQKDWDPYSDLMTFHRYALSPYFTMMICRSL